MRFSDSSLSASGCRCKSWAGGWRASYSFPREPGGCAKQMRAKILYRIAAVLLSLFAALHTIGFRQTDLAWKVNGLIASMQSIHFDVQGLNRTYWDFYTGFGLFVTAFLLFAAALAWQLSRLAAET